MDEYNETVQNKDISKEIDNGEAISMRTEKIDTILEYNKKKIHMTLEFPYTVDPKDAERFEKTLRQVYLNRIQKGSGQMAYNAVSSHSLKEKSGVKGGYDNE